MAKKKIAKSVEALTHDEATRKNIPTAEYQAVMRQEEQSPVRVAYERRNRDLDPQLVWRGKDQQDGSDLVVHAPPLYIQEKVHPKVLIDDLRRQSVASDQWLVASERKGERSEHNPLATDHKPLTTQLDLFADFNGLLDDNAKTEFYQHDQNWSNRMILGDSLQVMASLAEREGLRGQVQCIYLDPPYGIKFNSNFQWSTTSRDVKDGNVDHITREPEQVKAFRDTWRDGIHSYLTYLRDRLTVARDLLTDSGSIFVQIGDENVHRVRAVMDEVFGDDNHVALISVTKTSSASAELLAGVNDFIIWYAKDRRSVKYRQPYRKKSVAGEGADQYRSVEEQDGNRRSLLDSERLRPSIITGRVFRYDNMTSQRPPGDFPVPIAGRNIRPRKGYWKTGEIGMARLSKANRLALLGDTLSYVRYLDDFPVFPFTNVWSDTVTSGFGDPKVYVVQTLSLIVERCLLMATDPGDLVLDPTCGSGTTAYVAEQWGRRWITLDTSRVALALARARIMGARYPYYLLADSRDGRIKEAEITRTAPSEAPTHGNLRHGFVYERVPHITLKSIANNAEVDVIWEKHQQILDPLREKLSRLIGQDEQDGQDKKRGSKPHPVNPVHPVQSQLLEEWEIPRDPAKGWSDEATRLHTQWWQARIARQSAIDASIAAKADVEYLYDKPYEDRKKVRVAGPFTVESLSPHRVLGVDENDELIDTAAEPQGGYGKPQDFASMILENLKTAGVQQAHKEDKIAFTSLAPWPGDLICAEGRFRQDEQDLQDEDDNTPAPHPVHPVSPVERRAAIFIGPEFGTVTRPDLVAAAREAGDADFDVLIACAFNYEAHATEFNKLGRIPVLKARMNADLHMADDLKTTGKGNLFVVFGEPDIDVIPEGDGHVRVKVKGVDVFHPSTGEVRSDGADGIACWFVDTDYNEESFFVRHAYFLGASDPYKSLKTTLKAEIDPDAWATLHSDTSRPFPKPKNARIAVKVINHLGDEVMKVFRV